MKLKYRIIIMLVVSIFTLAHVIFNIEKLAIVIPYIFLLLTIGFIVLPKHDKKGWLNTYLLDLSKKDISLPFFLIPGYKILGKDIQSAREGSSGTNTTLLSFAILIIIVSGAANLPALLIVNSLSLTNIPTEWYSWVNRALWYKVYIGSAITYVVMTVILNILVQLAIMLGNEQDINKELQQLTEYFGLSESQGTRNSNNSLFWNEYTDNSKYIYGHKTWAGKKIKDMIETISRKEQKLGTSRWFLLDFAAEVMDHAVKRSSEGGSSCIEHTYPNEYPYSLFLADKMNYSRKSMIWITDHRDFVKAILPMLIAETVIGIACMESTNNSPLKKLTEMDSLKKKEFLSQDDNQCINGACGAFSKHFELDCPEKRENRCKKPLGLDDRETEKEFLCRALCLSIMKLSDMDKFPVLSEQKLGKFFTEFDKRGTDGWELPHLKVYSRHPAMKSKIINIPNLSNTGSGMFDTVINDLYLYGLDNGEQQSDNSIENKDKIKSIVQKALEANFYKILFLSNFQDNVTPSLSDEEIHSCIKTLIKDLLDKNNFAENIFHLACKLYEHTCNSHTNHKLIGFAQLRELIPNDRFSLIEDKMFFVDLAENKKEPFWDVGLFDEHIFVSSKENENDKDQKGSKRRQVKWSYLGENDYLRNELMKFKPVDQPGSIPETIKEQFYSLDSFITDYRDKIIPQYSSDTLD